jgi:hypothetical protein
MTAEKSRVIVEDSTCACCAVHTKQVHHRDFPEIRAECGTVAEGAAHLAKQLTSAREGAHSTWHREVIDEAIADVAEFQRALAKAQETTASPCQCPPHAPGPLESAHAEHRPVR